MELHTRHRYYLACKTPQIPQYKCDANAKPFETSCTPAMKSGLMATALLFLYSRTYDSINRLCSSVLGYKLGRFVWLVYIYYLLWGMITQPTSVPALPRSHMWTLHIHRNGCQVLRIDTLKRREHNKKRVSLSNDQSIPKHLHNKQSNGFTTI